MPEKYEREIEDMLRNLKSTEPKANVRRMRRGTGVRFGKPVPQLNVYEWNLLIAIIAALSAGGWAYANGGGNLITGLIALIGMVCIAIVALSSFFMRAHSSSSAWR